MTIFYTILASAAALFPSVLHTREPEHRFTRAGVTYIYTVTAASDGRQVIEGHRLPSGSAFRLVVNGDRVDGVSGGQPVAFRTATAAAEALAAR